MDKRRDQLLRLSSTPFPFPFPPHRQKWDLKPKVQSSFKCLLKFNCKSKVALIPSSLTVSLLPPYSLCSSPRPLVVSLICSPDCSTVSRHVLFGQRQVRVARICPRTSRSPASGLWMDGTVFSCRSLFCHSWVCGSLLA